MNLHPRLTIRLRALASTAACIAVGACSSSGAGQDGGAVNVSFGAEVMPIFRQSCALSASCHGDPFAGPLRPYLGSVDGGGDAPTILAGLVGVASAENPTMNLVSVGDPAQSFLMHKMDGDQSTLAAACGGTIYSASYPNCGESMPSETETLPAAIRDTVRAWIKQGAK